MNRIIRDGKFAILAQKQNRKKMSLRQIAFAQPKLDGVRCIAFYDEEECKVKLFSRNGKEFLNSQHIAHELLPFFLNNKNFILDGELYNHLLKDDFNKIISLVRKTKPKMDDVIESAKLVQYHVYDSYDQLNPLWEYSGRMQYVKAELDNWLVDPVNGSIGFVESYPIKSEEDIQWFHKRAKDKGFEGSMLRADIEYQVGKRSHFLQKVKDFMDAEFTIVDVVEGKGKLQGMVGKWVVTDGVNLIGAPMSSHSFEDRKDAFENKEFFLGKKATVEFFEYTPAGVPRFPVFKAIRNYE